MRRKLSNVSLLALSLFAASLIPACGGQSSDTPPGNSLGAACRDSGALCVLSCTLGCSNGSGCSVSEIAVNQPLRWRFSQPVDPASVNSESVSIRAPGGGQPRGTYVVQGNEVLFVPSIRTQGNQTLFGFAANETYEIVIKGADLGGNSMVRTVSGGPMGKSFRCQVSATRGVIDIDGKKPSATLAVPSKLSGVARNSVILIEFSEVINTQIFQNGGAGAGILYTVSLLDENDQCERRVKNLPGVVSVKIDETNNKSTVVFRPSILLPANACVQVQVTEQIRDLSGKGANPISWEFQTVREAVQSQFVEEKFANKDKFDSTNSGAIWGSGSMVPGKMGGSGALGEFKAADGKDLRQKDSAGRDIYEWNSDGQTIPAIRTLSGQDITVTNGVFEFTTFVLKKNERIRFVGKQIPTIRVSGKMQIDGAIELYVPKPPASNLTPTKGWAGGLGGPGGGSGGQGADMPTTTGGSRNGRAGGTVKLAPGHPRASSAAGTGGGGSVSNPKTGLTPIWIKIASTPVFCRQTAAGGAGGSLWSPDGKSYLGTAGEAKKEGSTSYAYVAGEFGERPTPGKAFPVLPLVSTKKSTELFAIGGSGGGGGGSDPFNSFNPSVTWHSGAGGAGGGGAIILQSGGDLVMDATAEILARGGNAINYGSPVSPPYPAPGGGGSGGSVLFQSAGIPTILGTVNVLGGTGGYIAEKSYLGMASYGGNGGAGYIRVEADPAPSHTSYGKFQPAATTQNVGLLRKIDHNDVTIGVSKWYGTNSLFTPSYRYYVIEATIDSKKVVYSDNTKISTVRAVPGEPVVLLAQSAAVNQLGQPIDVPTPWVEESIQKGGVKRLNDYEGKVGNGVRFMLRLDTKGGTRSIAVTNVKIFYRG